MYFSLCILFLFFGFLVSNLGNENNQHIIGLVEMNESYISRRDFKDKLNSMAAKNMLTSFTRCVEFMNVQCRAIDDVLRKNGVCYCNSENHTEIMDIFYAYKIFGGISPYEILPNVNTDYISRCYDGVFAVPPKWANMEGIIISPNDAVESLRTFAAFLNLLIVSMKRSKLISDEVELIPFDLINEINVMFDKLFNVLGFYSKIFVSENVLRPFLDCFRQLTAYRAFIYVKTCPEGINSNFFKLIQGKKDFTDQQFYKALGFTVEMKLPEEMGSFPTISEYIMTNKKTKERKILSFTNRVWWILGIVTVLILILLVVLIVTLYVKQSNK